MNIGTEAVPSKNNLLTTIAWKIGSKIEYALEGSVRLWAEPSFSGSGMR